LASYLEGVSFPVELALPHRVVDFLPIAGRMAEIRDVVRGRGIEVLSVHAPQGRLADDGYEAWANPAMWLADELGAGSVTFHPQQAKSGRESVQHIARQHLRALQRKALALAAIETFGGGRRIFRPEEIAEQGLPMVLDVAHLHDNERVLGLIRGHHRKITTVHLSARGGGEHHLPIDAFCLEVLGLLAALDWPGAIVLEYLPWHHYRVTDDLVLLRQFLEGDEDVAIPPPDDAFRDDPSKWGFV
jgi:sugar phosphate isomerase/epimerase